MTGPRVRLAGPDDVAVVARLMGEFRDWFGKLDPPDSTIRSTVDRLIDGGTAEFLLAGDPPSGVCQLRYRLSVWTGVDDCWLEDLYVRDSARGQGLGRALVDEACSRARARGCKRIELDVNDSNEAALALYEAAGFSLEPKPPGGTRFIAKRL